MWRPANADGRDDNVQNIKTNAMASPFGGKLAAKPTDEGNPRKRINILLDHVILSKAKNLRIKT